MTRDEYVRQAAERLAELRGPTVAGDIEIPDDVLAAGAGALEAILGRPCRWEAQTILAAALPLIRAQVAAELRTCQETAASLLANDSHLHECEREAGHRSPRHRCPCGCEWWPLVEWERPFITPAAPSTSAAPGWCRWYEMVDCHGDTPFCREARAELDGDEARQREDR